MPDRAPAPPPRPAEHASDPLLATSRFRRCAALLLGAFLLLAPTASAQEERGGRALWREKKRLFEEWWKKVDGLQLLLQGDERRPEPARTLRREAAALLLDLARSLEVKDVAPMLWKVALFEVDPEHNLGLTHLRAAPWFLRTEARKALATLPPDELVPWLLEHGQKKGKAKESSPRLAASEILALLGGDRVKAPLLALFAKADEKERIEIASDLARALPGDDEAIAAVLAVAGQGAIAERCALAHALASLAAPRIDETKKEGRRALLEAQAQDLVGKLGRLALEDASWQVRLAAADALARLKCRAGIEMLIAAFARESERLAAGERVEVRNRIHALLEGVTGQSIGADRPEWWKEWWAKNGASFTVAEAVAKVQDRATKNAGYLQYFQLEITSDRILFIVDRSGSMAEPAARRDRYGKQSGQTSSKFAYVQDELETLLQALPETTQVNVLFFGDGVEAYRTTEGGRPELIPLTTRGKSEIVRYVRNIAPNGGTNLYTALDRALDIAGRGLKDSAYESAFDTIYLLSDGKPTAGPVIDEDEILRRVDEVNVLRRVKIHAITFGDQNNAKFVAELATRSGGRHVHMD
ncbi:MAG: VWA domain-containing protein [Planctomycetes bacterium]|nr:VWA domain-containing protein [Planctomycetota bacterium]